MGGHQIASQSRTARRKRMVLAWVVIQYLLLRKQGADSCLGRTRTHTAPPAATATAAHGTEMVVVGAQQPQHQHQHTRQKDAARPHLYENEILETRRRQGQLPSPRLSYPLGHVQRPCWPSPPDGSFAKIPPVRYSKWGERAEPSRRETTASARAPRRTRRLASRCTEPSSWADTARIQLRTRARGGKIAPKILTKAVFFVPPSSRGGRAASRRRRHWGKAGRSRAAPRRAGGAGTGEERSEQGAGTGAGQGGAEPIRAGQSRSVASRRHRHRSRAHPDEASTSRVSFTGEHVHGN